MFDPTQQAQQRRPTTTSVVRPIKSAERPTIRPRPNTGQCYSLNTWTSHWCKVLSFHWTALMQDTLDITGAGCEYDFIWWYTVIPYLHSERIQHRSTTVVWL